MRKLNAMYDIIIWPQFLPTSNNYFNIIITWKYFNSKLSLLNEIGDFSLLNGIDEGGLLKKIHLCILRFKGEMY